MITTANLFAGKGHKVTLLVIDHTAATYYPVHPTVQITHAPLNFGIMEKGNIISRKIRQWKDIRKLKRIVRELQTSLLICAEYQIAVAAILGGVHKFTRVFSWEHHHFRAQHLNKFWQYLFSKTYPKLDTVVCLNNDERDYYLPYNSKAVVIPNFISPPADVTGTKKEFELLSVTRFNHIKGIDLLMRTAELVLPENPEWKWKVIGYGEQQDEFLSFIQKKGLSGQLIYQPADKSDITREYQSAAIHVMTSRNECFPLVLLEAMSNGLPCIAFDCDTGPRHIIQHEKTGILVPAGNVEMMAAAITNLVKDESRQKKMAAESSEAVKVFYPEKVYELWKSVFDLYN